MSARGSGAPACSVAPCWWATSPRGCWPRRCGVGGTCWSGLSAAGDSRSAAMPDEIDPQRPYGRSDPVFTRDLALGWEAELYVRAKLDEAGVPDVVPGVPLEIRPTFAVQKRFSDRGIDVVVGKRVLQVKRRMGYRYGGIEDFPFETAIFDSVEGFDRWGDKADCYVLVSGDLRGIVVVPRSTYGRRVVEQKYDPTRRAERPFVAVPIAVVWPWETLLRRLGATTISLPRRPGDPIPVEGGMRTASGYFQPQPPAYQGRTWPMATKDGVVNSPSPPLRTDPHELT